MIKARAFPRQTLPSPDRCVDRGKVPGAGGGAAHEAMRPSVQTSPARATCRRDPPGLRPGGRLTRTIGRPEGRPSFDGLPATSTVRPPPSARVRPASILRSISFSAKPVASMRKSRSRLLSSASSTPSRPLSQAASSPSRLSAIMKARRWASSRWSSASVGTSLSLRRRAASSRPWPASTPPRPSTRIGTLNPNAAMLSAILATWRAEWISGVSGIGRQSLDRQPADRNPSGRLIRVGHEKIVLIDLKGLGKPLDRRSSQSTRLAALGQEQK